jgi:uncharacterized protein YihD (DUF1040 family)
VVNCVEITYAPVCRVFNEVYDCFKPSSCKNPPFSFLRVMMIVWRREVFEKLFKDLINGILLFIEKIRKAQREEKNFDFNSYESEIILISRY